MMTDAMLTPMQIDLRTRARELELRLLRVLPDSPSRAISPAECSSEPPMGGTR